MKKHNTKKCYRNRKKPVVRTSIPETEMIKSVIPQSSLNQTISWEEYSHIHDSFIEQLSYDWDKKYSSSNIWEYSYV